MWLFPLLPFVLVIILHFAFPDEHGSQPPLWQGLAASIVPCLVICALVWRATSMTL